MTAQSCAGLSTVDFLEIDQYGDFVRYLFVIDDPIKPSNTSAIFFAEIGEFGGQNWESGAYDARGQAIYGSVAQQELWRETNRIRLCPTGGVGDEVAGEFRYSTGGLGGLYPGEPRWTWQMGSSNHYSTGGGGWNFGQYLKNDLRFRVSTGNMQKGRIVLFGIHGS